MIYSGRLFNDGSYFIANKLGKRPGSRLAADKTERDLYFDEVYKTACVKYCVTPQFIYRYCREQLVEKFGEMEDLDEYLEKKFAAADKALYQREQRMWRKARLNRFTHFYTQTYDSEKYASEAAFERDYKKCLQNMCTRRGWKYFYRAERGKDTDRLHFHAVIYVPSDSQIPGFFKLKRDYNPMRRKMETLNVNSFFARKFGRNDFSPICDYNSSEVIKYVGKYLDKSNDKIVYSRGLPTYLSTDIRDDDVVAELPIHKQDDSGQWSVAFNQYVTYNDFIKRSPLVRWYRADGVEVLPRAG